MNQTPEHFHMFINGSCNGYGATITIEPDYDYLLKYYFECRLEGMSDELAMDVVRGLKDNPPQPKPEYRDN